MKTIVGTVVYKAAEPFLEDFFKSVCEQDCSDFEVLVLNDNIDGFSNPLCETVDTKGAFKPYELRIILLEEAKKRNCDLLIVGDCDDCLSKDRVRGYIESWDSGTDFFYNDLVGMDGRVFFREIPEKVVSHREIGEKNFLGLGNSGINVSALDDGFISSLRDGDTNIFDWYLFSRMLLAGKKGRKTEFGSTCYRLHGGNIAGRTDSLKRELEVKLEHYRLLEKYDPYYRDLLNMYSSLDLSTVEDRESDFWWGRIELDGRCKNEI